MKPCRKSLRQSAYKRHGSKRNGNRKQQLNTNIMGIFFNDSYSDRARRDQGRLRVGLKNLISLVNDYGTCFSCGGNGHKTLTCTICEGRGRKKLTCNACSGTGKHTFPEQSCNACWGTGRWHHQEQACRACNGRGQVAVNGESRRTIKCWKCSGTGVFRPAQTESCAKCGGSGIYRKAHSEPCRRCDGRGYWETQCRKCGGRGEFTGTCRKCGGTGWHKF